MGLGIRLLCMCEHAHHQQQPARKLDIDHSGRQPQQAPARPRSPRAAAGASWAAGRAWAEPPRQPAAPERARLQGVGGMRGRILWEACRWVPATQTRILEAQAWNVVGRLADTHAHEQARHAPCLLHSPSTAQQCSTAAQRTQRRPGVDVRRRLGHPLVLLNEAGQLSAHSAWRPAVPPGRRHIQHAQLAGGVAGQLQRRRGALVLRLQDGMGRQGRTPCELRFRAGQVSNRDSSAALCSASVTDGSALLLPRRCGRTSQALD